MKNKTVIIINKEDETALFKDGENEFKIRLYDMHMFINKNTDFSRVPKYEVDLHLLADEVICE